MTEDDAGFLERLAGGGDAGGGVDRCQGGETVVCGIAGNVGVARIDPPAGKDHRPAGEGSRSMAFEQQQFPPARRVAQQDDGGGGDGGRGSGGVKHTNP